MICRHSKAANQWQINTQIACLGCIRKTFCMLFITLFFCLSTTISRAEQTNFTTQRNPQGYDFIYQWQDDSKNNNQLSFSVSHEALAAMPNSAPRYNPQLAQNSMRVALLHKAKTIDPRKGKIEVKKDGASIAIKVSGKDKQNVQEISDFMQEQQGIAEQEYLHKSYMAPFKTIFGQAAIKQDHKRYALESAQGLTSIVDALKNTAPAPSNAREFVNKAVSWVQSIPYNTLEDRLQSNGAGYASPKHVLMQNQGDCDSKSVLAAALIKAYDPSIQVAMFYLPQHALLGAIVENSSQDLVMSIDNQRFVMFEPTGPAYIPVGEVDDKSRMYLRNRQFVTEVF